MQSTPILNVQQGIPTRHNPMDTDNPATPKKSDRVAAFMAGLAIDRASPDLDPRYLGFFQCFNRGDYYEAHDVLEDLWLKTTGPDYQFYKGLIQIAGAFVHLRKQFEHPGHHHHGRRLVPASRLFRIAIDRLAPFAPAHLGVDLDALLALSEGHLKHIEDGGFLVNPWTPDSLPEITLGQGLSNIMPGGE